jgi:hypothetical protein
MTTEDQQDRRTAKHIIHGSGLPSDAELHTPRYARLAGIAAEVAMARAGVKILRERGEEAPANQGEQSEG